VQAEEFELGTTNFASGTTDIKQRATDEDRISGLNRVLAQKAQQEEQDAVASKAMVEKTKTTLITEAAIAAAATKEVIADSSARPDQPIYSPLLRPRSVGGNQDGTQTVDAPTTVYGKSIGKVISSSMTWALEQNAKYAFAPAETEKPKAAPVDAELVEATQADTVHSDAIRVESAPAKIATSAAAESETDAAAKASILPSGSGLDRIEPERKEPIQEEPVRQDTGHQEPARGEAGRDEHRRTPVLAVFSLAGGVGKTNLVATLGRVFSSQGQTVLVADTTSRGLLPFYFEERGIGPGEVRTVEVPSGAALGLAVYDTAASSTDEQELGDVIMRDARNSQRVLVDVTTGSSWVIRRLANLRPVVLVPMTCDMNSVISLHAVEKIFQGIVDPNGLPLRTFYLLNQFDESLELHREVFEALGQQLGDRLLHRTIQRSESISEALAVGMTVVDYAPDAPVSREFSELASWLRGVSPATAGVVAAGR